MLLQLDYASVITLVLISYLGVTLILFFSGIYIMQMYVSAKEWDKSFKIPIRISLILMIINLGVGIPLTFLFGDSVVLDFIRFGINMVLGTFLALKYYKRDTGESIQFTLVVQFILFILAVIFSNIFAVISLYVVGS